MFGNSTGAVAPFFHSPRQGLIHCRKWRSAPSVWGVYYWKKPSSQQALSIFKTRMKEDMVGFGVYFFNWTIIPPTTPSSAHFSMFPISSPCLCIFFLVKNVDLPKKIRQSTTLSIIDNNKTSEKWQFVHSLTLFYCENVHMVNNAVYVFAVQPLSSSSELPSEREKNVNTSSTKGAHLCQALRKTSTLLTQIQTPSINVYRTLKEELTWTRLLSYFAHPGLI